MTESFIAFSEGRYRDSCRARAVEQSERQITLQDMIVQLRDINARLSKINADIKAYRLSTGVSP